MGNSNQIFLITTELLFHGFRMFLKMITVIIIVRRVIVIIMMINMNVVGSVSDRLN